MRLSRRLPKMVLVFGVLAAGVLCSGGLAVAAPPQVYASDFSFGPGGVGSSAFGNTQSIAVDDSAGAVYVYDDLAGSIYKFNTHGEPQEFTGLGADVIEGVGVAGADEVQVAVDNSAAGPAKGDIYVANGAGVRIYAASGVFLGELGPETGDPWGEPCGVAVDSTGSVYVGLYPGEMNKYTPTANPPTNTDYVSSLNGLLTICNVAADSTGAGYAVSYAGGPVNKYPAGMFSTIGEPVGEGQLIDAAGSTLAVEQTTDEVFVDEGNVVAQFTATGEPVRRFAEGEIEGSFGVAVDQQDSSEVFVADSTSGQVKAYKLVPILVPSVEDQPPTATPTGKRQALLTGTINPNHGETTYQFQYGTSTGYGQETALRTLPAGASDVKTTPALITDLQPSTQYHYRLIATNVTGTTTGPDHTFTTGALAPPAITISPATGITAGGATLTASVDTHELQGTYQFELQSSTAGYLPVTFGNLTPTASEQPLTVTLAALAPGTQYRYRLTASTPDGATQSQEATFTTTSFPGITATSFPTYPDLTHQTPAPRVKEPKEPKKPKKKPAKKKKKPKKKAKKATIHTSTKAKSERKANNS